MKIGGRRFIRIVLAVFVMTLFTSYAFAVPQMINYQGYLTDAGGAPINGTVDITFAIYNDPVGEGVGYLLWSETQTGVTVTGGAFSVMLGINNAIDLPFDVQYYLGVNVNGDGEMTPRVELTSVPYAMRAGEVDNISTGAVTSATILNGTIGPDDIADGAVHASDINISSLKTELDSHYVAGSYSEDVYVYVTRILDSDGSVGHFPSIAIGADGLPVISYGSNSGLKVLHCGDASCSSGNTSYILDTSGLDISIAIGADGLPVIAYYNIATSDLKVLHCGDASCSSGNTTNIVDTSVTNISIAVGADGLPVISYLGNSNTELKVLHCGDASCSSGNTAYTVDSAAGTFSYGTSVAIGADGLPVVSYYDETNGDLRVLHCGDASCSAGNTAYTVASDGSVGLYSSIAIGSDNLPVISYYDWTDGDLEVLHCGDASCSAGNTVYTVDWVGDVGHYTSIAIGADNLPVISYYVNSISDLKMLHCGNAACTAGNMTYIVDPDGSIGPTTIAIGTDGLPIIAYQYMQEDLFNYGLKSVQVELAVRALIGGQDIADGSITGANIASSTITSSNIAAGAVTSAEIADGAVTTSQIQDGSITSNDIATGAVTSSKISAPISLSAPSTLATIKGTGTLSGPGVEGVNTSTGYGVSGTNTSTGSGVYGANTTYNNFGYIGTDYDGVVGTSNRAGGYGVAGTSNSGSGVRGNSSDGRAVDGYTNAGYALYGSAGVSGYGLYTPNKAFVGGNLELTGGGSSKVTYNTPRTHYYTVGGEGFVPWMSGLNYQNSGGSGGAFILTGSGYMVHAVDLPQGAQITNLKVFFDDTSASYDVSVSLRRMALATGSYAYVGSVTSSGATGNQNGNVGLSHAVDKLNYAYFLEAYCSSWQNASTVVMGAVITYTISEAP